MSGRVILDLRGLVLNSYYTPGFTARIQDEEGKSVPDATWAVSVFIKKFLNPILQNTAPINIIAALEGSNANIRRRTMFAQYKNKDEQDAGSEVIKEEKKKAMTAVESLLLGLGCMLVKTPTNEADDTIAWLVKGLEGGKIIYTVDKDLMQLRSHEVFLISPDGELSVFKDMDLEQGVPPCVIRMYKSLVGDPSDNYGGVKGFGHKGWQGLVAEYGYDGILELDKCVASGNYKMIEDSLAECEEKFLRKIYENKEMWKMCHWLATLHPEWCEMSHGEKVVRPQWAKRLPSRERLLKVLEPLGLDYFIPQFERFLPKVWLIDQPKWDKTKKADLFAAMNKSPVLGFDWESYDSLQHKPYQEARRSGQYVDTISQKLTGGSFCFGDNLQFAPYISVKHRDTANCDPEVLHQILKATEGVPRVAHNAKFEMTVAKTNFDYDFPVEALPMDTVLMVSYVDENLDGGLKKVSKAMLNYDQTTYREVVPEGMDMRDISGQEVMAYGADDSMVCAHLYVLCKAIMECENTWKFHKENEPFFDKALLVPFLKGIPIDYQRMSELEAEDAELFEKSETELRELLLKHCYETNEEGFNILWPEVAQIKQATMRHKMKEEDFIKEKLGEIKAEVRQHCAYRPFSAPKIKLNKTSLSKAARSLGFVKAAGLPVFRSLKKNKIEDWVQGIYEQDVELDEDQKLFVELLQQAASEVEAASLLKKRSELPEDSANLFNVVEQVYARDKSLWAGDELNVGSSLQMAQLFYGKMGLPIHIRNMVRQDDGSVRDVFDLEGAPSTNEIAIRTWMVELDPEDWKFRVCQLALTLRGIRTRNNLYYRPYPLWQSPIDGRIHPGIRNCGTITRRPSSSSPNVFQVSKTKDDGKMRGCFLPLDEATILYVSPDGTTSWVHTDEKQMIVSIDFVQQELVILAAISKDPNLLACYVGDNKRDVHTTTAVAIINMGLAKLGQPRATYDEAVSCLEGTDTYDKAKADSPFGKKVYNTRKKYAKTTNFLVVYGGSAAGLARKIIVPKETAQEFIDAFNNSYPGVLAEQERVVASARKYGYVKTLFGTRKHCSGIFAKNKAVRAGWERQAINFPIQGCAADILKVVLRKIVQNKVMELTGATIYAPVYDEVVASVPVSKIYLFLEMMADCMELELPGTGVRLSTSASLGPIWGEQTEIGVRPSEETVSAAIKEILNALC